MQEEKIEAVVLRACDYQEKHRILTLFSSQGLSSCIVKRISKKNTHLLALSSVFTHGEYLLKTTHSTLSTFIDGSLINAHLQLRQNLLYLKAAATLTQAILFSQLPGKPAPQLFALYQVCLKQIPSFADPASLTASFHLKLLYHEGLLALSSECTLCKETPASVLYKGESLCHRHLHTPSSHLFLSNEWEMLDMLLNARRFVHLRALTLPLGLAEKISHLFYSRIKE